MTPNETPFFSPLPDREEFEWKIRGIFDDGDIKYIAGLLQLGRTSFSKMLNPGEDDRHNPAWIILGILWGFDLKGTDQADELLRVIGVARAMWQPRRNIQPIAGKTAAEMGRAVVELLEQEVKGASEERQLEVCLSIRELVDKKADEIMAVRGLRVSVGGVGDVNR